MNDSALPANAPDPLHMVSIAQGLADHLTAEDWRTIRMRAEYLHPFHAKMEMEYEDDHGTVHSVASPDDVDRMIHAFHDSQTTTSGASRWNATVITLTRNSSSDAPEFHFDFEYPTQ